MASPRIHLPMAPDGLVPGWFSAIHDRLLTPHRAILATGLVAVAFLLVESLRDLAKIASPLQLCSQAALNVGWLVLRVVKPDVETEGEERKLREAVETIVGERVERIRERAGWTTSPEEPEARG